MSMNVRQVVGIALLILGIVALASGGISWTHSKTIIDVGPIKATTQEHERIPLPPVLGAVGVVGGILLLVLPGRQRA